MGAAKAVIDASGVKINWEVAEAGEKVIGKYELLFETM